MSGRYGSFDRENGEFVIRDPATPRPWINYLFNRDYCALISATAGGYSFLQDCRLNLVTRWQGQNLLTDEPGRYVYLRDEETGRFWSATWRPVKARYEDFECRHGFGWTRIAQTADGIRTEVLYFVPRGDPVEVWDVRVRNVSQRERRISTFSCAEMVMGSRDREMQYRNIACLQSRAEYRRDLRAILVHKVTPYPNQLYGFFAASLAPAGHELTREAFLGPLGSYADPAAVRSGECRGTVCCGEDVLATLQHRFALGPGGERRFHIVMGCYDGEEDLAAKVALYTDTAGMERKLAEVRDYWAGVRGSPRLETPDPDFDVLANDWLKLQLTVTNYWARSPSFYHEGFGGFGFRDSAQDAEGIVGLDADYARYKLGWLLKCQKQTGQPMPGWSVLSGIYPHDPFKDHPIWLPFTVSAYVKETGDLAFLGTEAPFCDGGSATVYEHLRRSVLFLSTDTGERGFIHFGQNRHADWNDAFDGCTGNAESVWLTIGLCRSLVTMAELADRLGRMDDAAEYRRLHAHFAGLVNAKAWDGEWYQRGFSNSGRTIGSRDCAEGRIFLNPQSWAVLAGVADADRGRQCLDSALRLLDSDAGLQIHAPPYVTKDTELGRITYFAPGTKENGAVFCHAVAFMVAALCRAGRGDDAYAALSRIMPSNKDQERYAAEPYAFAEYIVGPSHPTRAGQGQFTWITGTAAWVYVIATQWVAGLRPEFDGLLVDPCLPSKWRRLRLRRRFRGADYDVEVQNPDGAQKGVRSVEVDGRRLAGAVLPPYGDGAVHRVKVVMGA